MNREDRQIRDLLLKADTLSSEHESQLHSRIMRQLPTRSLRRIYLIVFFAILWGSGISLFITYWQEIAHALLTMTRTLLDYQLPSMETFVTFALSIGAIVFIIVESWEAMNEYYEYEIRQMLENRS